MNGRPLCAALMFVASGLVAPAAAQELVPTLVRLDSLGVIRQLTAAGFEVAGVEQVDGIPHAVIVTAPAQRAAVAGMGLAVRGAPEVVAAPPRYFRTLAQVHATLDSLAAAGLVRLDTIGASWEGRPIVGAKVGLAGDAPERPNILFLGVHHAREWISAEMALQLLEAFAGGALEPALVAQRDVWVIPVVNPDGYQFSFDSTRLWRKNRRVNADATVGVDLNRNYPGLWGRDDVGSSASPVAETYRGPGPASEPETQAVIAFHARHPPVLAVSYHSYTNLVLYPYAHAPGVLAPDVRQFAGTAGTPLEPVILDALPGTARRTYHPGPGWQLYPTNGDYTEWAYLAHGTLAFTVELTAGCCLAGAAYGFLFPDDSAAVARVVADNLPFAAAVLRATDAGTGVVPSWEVLWPEAHLLTAPGASPAGSATGPRVGTLALVADTVDRGVRAWRWRAPLDGDVAGLRLMTGLDDRTTRVLYADGAEQETGWGGWPRDSAGSVEGSWHWRSETDTLRSPEIPTGGVTDPRVAFWVRHDGSLFLPDRYATVDVSTDRGASWRTVLRLEGAAPAWYPVSATLPDAPSVRLRIVTRDLPLRVDAVHVFGTARSTEFTVADGALELSENPVRSDRVFFTWQPAAGEARLSVFTFTGLLIHRASPSATLGEAVWDLTDLTGAAVGNGAYAIILEIGGQVLRRRLFVARAR